MNDDKVAFGSMTADPTLLPLHEWESFYVIIGTSAAALTGLMFVVIAVVADAGPRAATPLGIATFITPTIVHFCGALLISAIISAPWHEHIGVQVALGACGIIGFVWSLLVWWGARRVDTYSMVFEDWAWHVALPLVESTMPGTPLLTSSCNDSGASRKSRKVSSPTCLERAPSFVIRAYGRRGQARAMWCFRLPQYGADFMKKFCAIYLGTPAGMEKWKKLDDATRKQREQQGMKAWGDWANKNQAAIADMGSPLGKTKRADASGIKDTTNAMAAWTIVQAESHEAAAKLFENHPHFTIFPGESIEIMECLPIPGM